VYKRFFMPHEVGGDRVLHAGHWFVLVGAP
jgi:hypothetical protein